MFNKSCRALNFSSPFFVPLHNEKTTKTMVEVSTRDFRANYGKFLGMASKGEEVVLRSRNKGCFRLVPVDKNGTTDEEDSDTFPLDLIPELTASLQEAKEYLEGRIELPTVEAFIDELKNNPD